VPSSGPRGPQLGHSAQRRCVSISCWVGHGTALAQRVTDSACELVRTSLIASCTFCCTCRTIAHDHIGRALLIRFRQSLSDRGDAITPGSLEQTRQQHTWAPHGVLPEPLQPACCHTLCSVAGRRRGWHSYLGRTRWSSQECYDARACLDDLKSKPCTCGRRQTAGS
jgi:hypothetical protein